MMNRSDIIPPTDPILASFPAKQATLPRVHHVHVREIWNAKSMSTAVTTLHMSRARGLFGSRVRVCHSVILQNCRRFFSREDAISMCPTLTLPFVPLCEQRMQPSRGKMEFSLSDHQRHCLCGKVATFLRCIAPSCRGKEQKIHRGC